MATLTLEERTRVYCCLTKCEICGARRGEYCKASNRYKRPWTKGYHGMRSPFAHRVAKADRAKVKARLKKLTDQIINQREVVGHE